MPMIISYDSYTTNNQLYHYNNMITNHDHINNYTLIINKQTYSHSYIVFIITYLVTIYQYCHYFQLLLPSHTYIYIHYYNSNSNKNVSYQK
jgi:hypothetical protein